MHFSMCDEIAKFTRLLMSKGNAMEDVEHLRFCVNVLVEVVRNGGRRQFQDDIPERALKELFGAPLMMGQSAVKARMREELLRGVIELFKMDFVRDHPDDSAFHVCSVVLELQHAMFLFEKEYNRELAVETFAIMNVLAEYPRYQLHMTLIFPFGLFNAFWREKCSQDVALKEQVDALKLKLDRTLPGT